MGAPEASFAWTVSGFTKRCPTGVDWLFPDTTTRLPTGTVTVSLNTVTKVGSLLAWTFTVWGPAMVPHFTFA